MTQKNRTDLQSEISTNINDNTTGDISAADIRGALQDLTDSCFNILADGQIINSIGTEYPIAVDNTNPASPVISLDLSYANTWNATQTFTQADMIGTTTYYSVNTPYSFSQSWQPDGSGFYANGTSYSVTIYSYKDTPAGRVYDPSGSSLSFSDPNDANYYSIALTWNGYGDETGFIIYNSNTGGYVDVGNTNNFTINNYTSWSSATLGPTSITLKTQTLNFYPLDSSSTDIPLFGFSSNNYNFTWNGANQWLQFTDPSGNLQTIRADINSDGIYSTYINGVFYGSNYGYWFGATIGASYGGTGLGSYTQGDILYYNSGSALSKLAKNTTATRYLSNTGTNNNPAWAQINLTNGVTGILPIANGGTGSSTAPYVNAVTNTTLTRSGTGPYTLGVNLANTNTWTAQQIFPNAKVGSNLTIDASGQLGYGTTTPSYPLDVTTSGTRGGQFKNSTSSSFIELALANDLGLSGFYLNGSTRSSDGGANMFNFYNDLGGTQYRANGNYIWLTGGYPGTEKMRLTSAGLFGVGNTPTASIDAPASTTANASLRIRSGAAPTSPNDGDMWYDGTNLKFRVGGTTKTVTLT